MSRSTQVALLLLVFLAYSKKVLGQEELPAKFQFIGVTSGIDYQGVEVSEYAFIRGDIPTFTESRVVEHLTGHIMKWHVGAIMEWRSLSNKFGLLAGLRFTKLSSSIGRNTYWSNTTDFFYLLHRQSGTTTEYLKVKEVNESINSIGIPIALRYFPHRPRLFRLYITAGTELEFQISSQREVNFFNDEMAVFENDVLTKFNEADRFFMLMYVGVGWKFGKENKPNINAEIHFPAFVVAGRPSGLVDHTFGAGFQLSVLIPI